MSKYLPTGAFRRPAPGLAHPANQIMQDTYRHQNTTLGSLAPKPEIRHSIPGATNLSDAHVSHGYGCTASNDTFFAPTSYGIVWCQWLFFSSPPTHYYTLNHVFVKHNLACWELTPCINPRNMWLMYFSQNTYRVIGLCTCMHLLVSVHVPNAGGRALYIPEIRIRRHSKSCKTGFVS